MVRYKPFYGETEHVQSRNTGPETADGIIDGGVLDGDEVSRVKFGYGPDGEYSDVSPTTPLPVIAPERQKELLTLIYQQLVLLNVRFEEAFRTNISLEDIDYEN